MSGPIVVDVGNTRIKWGLCSSEQVWSIAALPPDDAAAWQKQCDEWKLAARAGPWIVSGVHPPRRDTLVAWLKERCDVVHVLTSHEAVAAPGRGRASREGRHRSPAQRGRRQSPPAGERRGDSRRRGLGRHRRLRRWQGRLSRRRDLPRLSLDGEGAARLHRAPAHRRDR